MLRNIFFLTLILNISINSFSQKENSCIGARSSGIGNASATCTDLWSCSNNQAGMAYFKNISVGVYYENRFLLKQTGFKCLTFAIPVSKSGVIGFNFSSFGYNNYSESKVGLGYAMQFGPKFSFGLQLDYLHTHIGDIYGNKGLVTFEVGLRSEIVRNFVIAVHVFNPVMVRISDYANEMVPVIFKFGASYNFSDIVLLCAEFEKDLYNKPVFKGGLEYHIVKPIYIRAGVSTNPTCNSLGFGFEFYKFKFDIAGTYNYKLGFSPQASLQFNFK